MDDQHIQPEFTLTLRQILITLALALGLVACTSLLSNQKWDEAAYGPVIPHDTFPADCSICHESGDWHEIKEDFEFDHEKETGVAFIGAHAEASCLLCHNDRGDVAIFAARGCAGCHEDIHRGTLGRNCDDCHSEQSWRLEDSIARHNRTRFPLVGAHAAAACFTCHTGAQVGNFAGLDASCENCHQADLARATLPDHIGQGLGSDCQRCHVPTTWQSARFAHPSSFPLTGSHSSLDCSICHVDNSFTPLPTDCASCHLADYQQTTDPNHATSGFSTNCTACHNTITWQGAVFNHTFPINSGPHSALSCSDCHLSPSNQTQFSCTDCHEHSQSEMAGDHSEVDGYIWSSSSCLQCHPDGRH